MDWHDRIVTNPAILVDKPVIKGTRISVELILGWLGMGWTFEQILKSYPRITREDIQAALAFAAERLHEEHYIPLPNLATSVSRIADPMNINLLANENFPEPAIRKLRAAGVDVVDVMEAMSSVSDREVIAYARREQRWLVTFDRDYGDLVFHEGLLPPPAILFFRQEPYPPDRPADIVLAMLSEPQQLEGCMVVISQQSIRCRRFPALGAG